MEKFKAFFEALLTDNVKLAFSRMAAQHVARIALYDLKGSDALQPDVKAKFTALEQRMAALGKPIRLQEGFRTALRQDTLYKQGRTTPGKMVTNAQGLQSYHNWGLAFDCVFIEHGYYPPDGWWETLGLEGEKLGLQWGGRWSGLADRPHFEHHPNGTWPELEAYFKAGTA